MPEFEVAVDVAVAPETAWSVVRDMRILERIDGSTLQERFLSRDEEAMTLTSSPLGDQ
jgi:hypothetical protein